MSAQPNPIRAALYGLLSVDAELTVLATGGIHHAEAPPDTRYPLVVFHRHSPGQVWSMKSFFRSDLWLVKGVCRGRDAAEAEAIDARCEELLNDAALEIDGAALLYLRRENGMPDLAEADSGQTVYQAGGLYRLQAEPT